MPVDRPTFSESWYRVADLRPRLISSIQVHRQHYRGQTWHVLADPSNNQFFRLSEPAYRFVAMLDGRRTVAEAWRICNDQLGDDAATQNEAIQLLGQLYTSNLLSAELPPDAEGLFNRYRKRVGREVKGYLSNLLFIRLPLLDPDHFLDRWVGVFGRLFTWYGGLLWAGLMAVGLYFVLGDLDGLTRQTTVALSQANVMRSLPLLYLTLALLKVAHEFGHAFACKRFGKQTGSGGEVHTMGVMFLIFTPMPYVDASSSWAFRSKWQRIVVGLGGMYVETAIAAVAAIVWARTAEGSLTHDLAYYVIFIAGVSTLLFNANPLLRYDGYYILSDLLEMPNLWQRSRQYVYYLVRRYVWAVRRPFNPANTSGERVWLSAYGVASTVYRVFICVAILLFIADKLFLLGAVLAVMAVIAWVLTPLGKFVHYLLTSGELMRVRGRAVATTLATVGLIVAAVGLIPAADRCRAEGVVEPRHVQFVYMRTAGFVEQVLPSGQPVVAGQTVLLRADNDPLRTDHAKRKHQLEQLAVEHSQAADRGDVNDVKAIDARIQAKRDEQADLARQLADLAPTAPLTGLWFSPHAHRLQGDYRRQGDPIGLVVNRDKLIIRAFVSQADARLIAEADKRVEMRVRGRPDLQVAGTIEDIVPAGQAQLPSAALGYAGGGSIPTHPTDREGTRAAERQFEIRIAPDDSDAVQLLSGQLVVVRFDTPAKPLAVQWWRAILQLVQKRFHI